MAYPHFDRMKVKILLCIASIFLTTITVFSISEIALSRSNFLDDKSVIDWKLKNPAFIPDKTIIFRPKPDYNDETDAYGFRKYVSSVSPYRKPTIVMIGDSFVYGAQVPSNQTIPALLYEQLLTKGIRSSVINAGSNGFQPDQELVWLSDFILQKAEANPDIVIWFIYPENDLMDMMQWPIFEIRNNQLDRLPIWKTGLFWALQVSNSFPRPLFATRSMQFLLYLLQYSNGNAVKMDMEYASRKLSLEILQMQKLAKKNNFELQIVLPPNDGVLSGSLSSVTKEDAAKNALTVSGVSYIDFNSMLRRIMDGDLDMIKMATSTASPNFIPTFPTVQTLFHDERKEPNVAVGMHHLNENGNIFVAALLADNIVKYCGANQRRVNMCYPGRKK
jgi:hypothetical protein